MLYFCLAFLYHLIYLFINWQILQSNSHGTFANIETERTATKLIIIFSELVRKEIFASLDFCKSQFYISCKTVYWLILFVLLESHDSNSIVNIILRPLVRLAQFNRTHFKCYIKSLFSIGWLASESREEKEIETHIRMFFLFDFFLIYF